MITKNIVGAETCVESRISRLQQHLEFISSGNDQLSHLTEDLVAVLNRLTGINEIEYPPICMPEDVDGILCKLSQSRDRNHYLMSLLRDITNKFQEII